MNRITYKILLSFCCIAAISVAGLIILVAQSINDSITQQSGQLSDAMKEQAHQSLSVPHHSFHLLIKEDVRNGIDRIQTNISLKSYLEAGHAKAMDAELHAIALAEDFDFMLLFDLNGLLEASFPTTLSDLDIEKFIRSWPFGEHVFNTLDEDSSEHNKDFWNTFIRYDSPTLSLLQLHNYDFFGKGNIGVVAAGLIKNDFDDPIGVGVAGKLFSKYMRPFQALNDIGDYASVMYLETLPIVHVGFVRTVATINAQELSEQDADQLQQHPLRISADMLETLNRSNGIESFKLTVAGVPYLLACSNLTSFHRRRIGAFCSGIPEIRINELQQVIMSSGIQVKSRLRNRMIAAGGLVLVFFAIVSFVTASKIVGPITKLSEVAQQIASGNLQQEIPSHTQDEIGRLAESFRIMKDRLIYLIQEINDLLEAIQQGKLNTRGTIDVFEGAWRELVVSVNNVLDAFTDPLALTANSLDMMVKGRIPQKITKMYQGDFNKIKDNLNLLIESTRHITEITQEISKGNLLIEVKKRSDNDMMMEALENMVNYLQNVAAIAEKVSQSDLAVTLIPQSEKDVLTFSLQRMVSNLSQNKEQIEQTLSEIERQNWLKTGQAELNDLMRGHQDTVTLAKKIIIYLARYVGAQVGVFYLRQEKQGEPVFNLKASYAYTTRKDGRTTFTYGEGLVGQAAQEQKGIIYINVPDDYIYISSGIGKTVPHSIIIVPFLYEHETLGVIELGSSEPFTRQHLDFLEQVGETIAITFHTTQARITMQNLFENSQQQAE